MRIVSRKLVYCLCVLHNLIKKFEDDSFFHDEFDTENKRTGTSTEEISSRQAASSESDEARKLRDEIAESMWSQYLKYRTASQS